MLVWLNGALVDEEAAQVSVFDHGLTVGDGVFETVKAVDGVPFALERHLIRLAHSAAGLGLDPPEKAQVRQACALLLALPDAAGTQRLRITYTAGRGPLGSERGGSAPTLVVALAALPAWPATASVATAPWPRNERGPLVGLKTTSYADNVVALAWARERGAAEALFADTAGRLCEGTGSNVFVVLDGRLLTPSPASGCLAGITRALVIEWCDASEVDLPMSVLGEAEEVFITSSTRDVLAVHDVDGRALSAPGSVTRACAAEFARRSSLSSEP